VNLSSGTRAGVVQILAQVNTQGRSIRSLPVSVAIHGGLPAQSHFSLGPARVNFPGLLAYGLTNDVSVVVGDKYANPVRPGTAVYFTTSNAVIEGSVLTNNQGRGTVKLISANPLPGDGIGVVTASTADDQQKAVTSQTGVIFSGYPRIQVTPGEAILGQIYQLRITDQNFNPLVQGTTIRVRAEGTKVKAVGHTNVELGDAVFSGGLTYDHVVRGPGITEFWFSVVPDLNRDEDGEPEVETVTISVRGGNGALEVVLLRGLTPVVLTDGAKMDTLGDGTIVIQAVE
jgi:hypothetical protein